MKNRVVGYLIIGIAILIGMIIFLFNHALTDIVNASCSHGASCPMWGTINFQTSVSAAIMLFTLFIGFFLAFFGEDEKVIVKIRKIRENARPKEISKKAYASVISGLNGKEREIFEKLIESKGSVMQSELVRSSDLNKVKVTRILDRLESMGLIERRRRGMSNMVLLKRRD